MASRFDDLDTNKDGSLSMDEFQAGLRSMFRGGRGGGGGTRETSEDNRPKRPQRPESAGK